MGIKAVFFINEVAKTASGAGRVKASPVAKGPYAEYSQYTPTGLLEFLSLNEAATDWCIERIGKDVTLTLADPTEADLITPPFKG